MPLNKVESISYVLADINYFFSYGEIIDFHMANISKSNDQLKNRQHIVLILDQMQQLKKGYDYLSSIINLFYMMHNKNGQSLSLDNAIIKIIRQENGLIIIHNLLVRLADQVKNSKQYNKSQSIKIEMSLKCLINILYIILFSLKNQEEKLFTYFKEYDLEDVLMKLIQASLEVNFIPIKKVIILFYFLLNVKFAGIYKITDSVVDDLKNNIITQNLLPQQMKNNPRLLMKDPNQVQSFFKRHNINQCSLAQFIVVGLLRALLTACNNTKAGNSNPVGVDAFREWRSSFIYATQFYQSKDQFPQYIKNLIELYRNFQSNDKKDQKNIIQNQIDRHRIYTAASITSFFCFLLIHFKHNVFLQYTYLIQLISDANGILVLLKFLTDKFQLANIQYPQLYVNNEKFFQKVKYTIYTVLLLLMATCNNFTEKIKSFLFDYNSFLILKKIPGIFEEDAVLTELSYELLKIQIPFFSKKMKESSNNMKMIAQIYCKYPKKVQPVQPKTQYQKLLLKNKIKPKKFKQILNVDQVKNIHVEFNNYNYWHAEGEQLQPKIIKQPYIVKLEKEVRLDEDFKKNYEEWLQKNVWRYYD